jgi:hypothetical protein
VTASKTHTFLGERYRRIARRRGKKRTIVAAGRSLLVIAWHLPSDPEARYHDLGPDFYDNRIGPDRTKRNRIRQREALGYKVPSNPLPDRHRPSPAPLNLRPSRCSRPPSRHIFGLASAWASAFTRAG